MTTTIARGNNYVQRRQYPGHDPDMGHKEPGMSVEGVICAYVRGAKNKDQAVDIAAGIYGIPAKKIRRILQENGLMTGNGEYIEPLRLTGKESTAMAEEIKRINWSKATREKLEGMFREGKTRGEMAEALGVEPEKIDAQLKKMGLAQQQEKEAGCRSASGAILVVNPEDDIMGIARRMVEQAIEHNEEAIKKLQT